MRSARCPRSTPADCFANKIPDSSSLGSAVNKASRQCYTSARRDWLSLLHDHREAPKLKLALLVFVLLIVRNTIHKGAKLPRLCGATLESRSAARLHPETLFQLRPQRWQYGLPSNSRRNA